MSTTSAKLIKGATGDWEMVIGLEVHAQVTSNSKLFSGASTEFGGEPNSHVSLVDAAMPGMLPVINEECVRQAVRTGLGLNAKINLRSVFDRKNYFYPDLPQGYQISQYKSPIVGEGEVVVELAGGETATVGIERLHLEQDAGKSLHDQQPDHVVSSTSTAPASRLMEIVSKPDIRSSEQAKAYVTKLRSILRYLGTCDGDMEKGILRADVNVSVRKPGGPLGTRCEIKNMNSISFIGQAIEYEARRQIEIIEDGGAIDQETRLFDPDKGETRSMRSKEEAHDYRYFPDPDLLPLEFSEAYVAELKAGLPELPDQKKARFIADFGLSPYDASVLVAERESAEFFETVLARLANKARDGKLAANWVINELFGRLNKEGQDITGSPVSAAQLGSHRRPDRRGHHLRQDRQGPVRDRLAGGRRPPRAGRGARHEAGHRPRRDREGGRRHHRRQSRQGRAGEGQAAADRLVRRPGDEVVRRQGQSAGRQRSAEVQTRHLNVGAKTTRGAVAGAVARCARVHRSFIHKRRRNRTRDEDRSRESAGGDSREKSGFGERR